MWQQLNACRHGQDDLLKFKPSIRTGKRDTANGMVSCICSGDEDPNAHSQIDRVKQKMSHLFGLLTKIQKVKHKNTKGN